jgi:maleate isomerase
MRFPDEVVMLQHHRIGLIVPSSNTTMETEVPELLRRQAAASEHRFSVHSARLRLKQVTPEALAAMNEQAGAAADSLADAECDALMYACLVALMSAGRSRIENTERELSSRAATISSAGALADTLRDIGAMRIAMIAPYTKALTARVAYTLGQYGIQVMQSHSLEIVDNVAVGRLSPGPLPAIAARFELGQCDALVLSACVQMPSLAAIDHAEQRFGLPVITAATASVYQTLKRLGIAPDIAGAGSLLEAGGARLRTGLAVAA